jgi:pSer/pThr/pTyr-binding forkhead associated (FHA) protein
MRNFEKIALTLQNQPSIFLEPDSRYTIGRELDNFIIVGGDLVSRHHAVIYRDREGQVFIEDLKSRNGTLVNGSRISAPLLLITGDRITVGTHLFSLKNLSSPKSPQDSEVRQKIKNTLPLSSLSDTKNLIGTLEHMHISELIASVEYHKKTGTLHLSQDIAQAKILFFDGQLFKAEFVTPKMTKKSMEALDEIFLLKNGVFEFVAEEILEESSEFILNTSQILLRYAQQA